MIIEHSSRIVDYIPPPLTSLVGAPLPPPCRIWHLHHERESRSFSKTPPLFVMFVCYGHIILLSLGPQL